MRRGLFGRLGKLGLNHAIQPNVSPIIFLTQWKIVGNSQVHTDPFLTQWKVEGNSVVDNNTILSCGDYSDVDGKYHVKISNGVTIFDIPLTEPLRKVNGVADTIEFPSNTDGKALVTRNFASVNLGSFNWSSRSTSQTGKNRYSTPMGVVVLPNCIGSKTGNPIATALCAKYNNIEPSTTYNNNEGIGIYDSSNVVNGQIFIYDSNANTLTQQAFKNYVQGIELIYQITPTTELIDVSPFPVSSTDTYTSANVVPYSAFEHTENKEIWSCGEYSAVDGKWHILVQPQGGSIADIALDAPLRKAEEFADTIEFANNTAVVTRNIGKVVFTDSGWKYSSYAGSIYTTVVSDEIMAPTQDTVVANILYCDTAYEVNNYQYLMDNRSTVKGIGVSKSGRIGIFNDEFINNNVILQDFYDYIVGKVLLFALETPTTELVDAPQIQEAESYTCVISQGGKAVSWSSFETE